VSLDALSNSLRPRVSALRYSPAAAVFELLDLRLNVALKGPALEAALTVMLTDPLVDIKVIDRTVPPKQQQQQQQGQDGTPWMVTMLQSECIR
jgi:hypothetical protein